MKKPPALHPFFFAVYAVLGVYAQHPQELPVVWILRPLLVLLGMTALVFLALRKRTGDARRAGLLATLILGWLFSGHLRNVLLANFSFPATFAQNLILLVFWTALLLALGSRRAWIWIKIPDLTTNFLNVTSWTVILVPTYFVIVFAFQAARQAKAAESQAPLVEPIALSASGRPLPDIYVIVLDAYGGEDFLNEMFDYDNRAFTDFLEQRGFYVVERSRPNYPQTQLTLASLLNFQYVNDWARELETTNNRAPLTEAILHSEVRRALEDIGYQTVNLPNSTLIGELADSDVYLPMSDVGLNQFERLILSTTALDPFAQEWDLGLSIPGYGVQRRITQYQLDALKTVPLLPGPKFTFVHILAPHPPFVFDRYGNPVQVDAPYTLGDAGGFPGTREEYEEGYRGQIAYLNGQMEAVIEAILEKSAEQPIIVIQGDHGPGSRFDMLALENVECLWERYSILNAYYFPDRAYDLLYPSITPVNSFRAIFNTFFGTDRPMLEDKNYYASYAAPYRFADVTELVEPSCNAP